MDTRDNHVNKKKLQKDQVSISNEAQEMLEAKMRSGTPERAQKIEDLKQQVSTGTYHVDAGKIAEKLLPYFKGNERQGDSK